MSTSLLKKKIPLWPVVIVAGVLIVLGIFYFYVNSVDDAGASKLMEAMDKQIELLIKQKEKNQEDLTRQIEEKTRKIEEFETTIDGYLKEIDRQKGKLKNLIQQPPFRELKEAQEEYNRLFIDYDNCLALSGKQEEAIKLFIQQEKELNERYKLQVTQYNECREQVLLLNTEVTGYKKLSIQLGEELKKKKRAGFWVFVKGAIFGGGVYGGVSLLLKLLKK